jgi:acyl dehydratase
MKMTIKDASKIQNATITDETVEKAKSMIGVWLRRDVHVPYIAEPISLHDIRRWSLYSVGDDNPLWMDVEYGKKSPWGTNIAPPTFLYTLDSTIVAPGLPGIQWIYGATRWEHFKPVKAGDTITAKARVIDVKEKQGKHAPRFIIQTGEVLYKNQNGELVARAEADILRVPRGRTGQGFRGFEQQKERKKYTPEEIDEIRLAYLNEEVRGSNPRYWDDVNVGDEMSPVVKGPLTLVDIVGFYSGRRTVYNPLKLAYLERERHPANVYMSPSTGVPVHPAAGHFDTEIADEIGMPGAYDQGWMRINWAGHLVTNWMSDFGFVKNLDVRVKIPNLVGDVTWCKGKVSKVFKENKEHLVELTLWGENQQGQINFEGRAVVSLPSREVN